VTLPAYYTPAEVAEHFQVSERALRQQVRLLGCCRVIGKRIFLTCDDVSALLDAWRPQPAPADQECSRVPLRDMGTSSTERALAHLERLAEGGKKMRGKK